MAIKIMALSIRQPWAALIIYRGKDIENRNWWTPFRGVFLIHAGTTLSKRDREDAKHHYGLQDNQLKTGGVVGMAFISECVGESTSEWFQGRYGFVLKGAMEVPFHPVRGQLNFFVVDYPHDEYRKVANDLRFEYNHTIWI